MKLTFLHKFMLLSIIAISGYSSIAAQCCGLLNTGASFTNYTPLSKSYLTPKYEEQWKSYGACYDYDELFIDAQPRGTRYIINKRIKILSQKGVKYGTLSLPTVQGKVKSYKFVLYDKSGNVVKIDEKDLYKQYEKNGTVIFPNITVGSTIQVFLDIRTTSALYYYDYWYMYKIPVMKSKFHFLKAEKLSYGFKIYNDPRTRVNFPIHKNYIMPVSYEGYQSAKDFLPPHISIVLKYAFDQKIINSWESLADYWSGHYDKVRIQHSGTYNLANSLVKNMESNFDKADILLKWVQENIIIDDDLSNKDSEVSKVFKTKRSNELGVEIYYNTMLRSQNIKADIVLSRSKFNGGFDKSFPDPSATTTPMSVVSIGKEKYVASTNYKGAVLGEYPSGFNGLYALSLRYKKAIKLPSPLMHMSKITYKYTFDPEEDDERFDVDIKYKGYVAFSIRSRLYDENNEDITEYFQEIFTDRSKGNALTKVSIENLKKRGTKLKVKAEIMNSDFKIEKKGVVQYSLSHLFNSLFTGIDTDRNEDFIISVPKTYSTEVEIVIPEGKKIEVKNALPEFTNSVFSVKTKILRNSSKIKIIREIKINKIKLSAEKFNLLKDDFIKLKDSKNISINIK